MVSLVAVPTGELPVSGAGYVPGCGGIYLRNFSCRTLYKGGNSGTIAGNSLAISLGFSGLRT
jgi:hypothetical protein